MQCKENTHKSWQSGDLFYYFFTLFSVAVLVKWVSLKGGIFSNRFIYFLYLGIPASHTDNSCIVQDLRLYNCSPKPIPQDDEYLSWRREPELEL